NQVGEVIGAIVAADEQQIIGGAADVGAGTGDAGCGLLLKLKPGGTGDSTKCPIQGGVRGATGDGQVHAGVGGAVDAPFVAAGDLKRRRSPANRGSKFSLETIAVGIVQSHRKRRAVGVHFNGRVTGGVVVVKIKPQVVGVAGA